MNVKTLVFVICVKAVIYLLLCNLHDCTFNDTLHISILDSKLRILDPKLRVFRPKDSL